MGAGVLASSNGERTYGKRLLERACSLNTLEACRLVDQINDRDHRERKDEAEREQVTQQERQRQHEEVRNRELSSEREQRAEENLMRTMIETQKMMFPSTFSPHDRTRCRTFTEGNEIITECKGR
jgi:hypothetical protein